MNKMPPKWAMRFFHWFCRKDLVDAIEGDLLELYERRLKTKGRGYANLQFIGQVISFFQPFAFKRAHEQYPQLNPFHMFQNNLKIGFRFMKKHQTFSAINILGLAGGLSAFILISLFVIDELSYDKFHTQGDQIVRLSYRLETPNATRQGAKLPFPIKKELQEKYPEVEDVARFYYWGSDTPLLAYQDQKHTENGLYFGETSVFNVFDFEWVRGNPETALEDPRSIVLTEGMALKYFGAEDPMGKTMRYKNEDDLIVTGILKNVPANSHITFDGLLPIELQRQKWMGWGQSTYDIEKDWNWAAAWVYTLLTPGTDLTAYEEKLQAIATEYLNTDDQDGFSIEMQPLYDIHLKSNKSAEAMANGNMTQVYSFAAIAVLIIFIACVNFINLTSVQTNKRLKELGLRKVMGARKKQLIAQFLTEAILVAGTASLIALIVAYGTLPYFNQFTNKSLDLDSQSLLFFIGLILLVTIVTMLSALRPSVMVMRLSAIQGLVNKFSAVRKKQRFNNSMVVGQFIVSNLLIVGILIVNTQLNFLQNKDLGFDKERMLLLKLGRNLSQAQFDVFQNKLLSDPLVENINRGYVAGTRAFTNTFKIVNNSDGNAEPNNDTYSLGIKWIGEGFSEMYDLGLVAGRDFDENSTTDIKSGVLINAAAGRALGWTPEESVGKSISFLPGGASTPQVMKIIGVMADANFESLYDPVLPSVFRRTESSVGSEITIKLAGGSGLSATLDNIGSVWEEVIPDWPFEYLFLDQVIEEQYAKEERLSVAIQYFTVLAIFITCLGLFGLATFTVQQRTKEVGIRKVLGASIPSIFRLVTKKYIWLVTISFLVSTPLAYYLFNQWLQSFAYRVEMGPTVFIIAGLSSIVIATIAIGGQSLKAATGNPTKTLRYE